MASFLLLLNFFILCVGSQEDFQEKWEGSWDYYHGQGASLIDWKGLNPLRWLDLDIWKRESIGKRNYHFWKEIHRRRRLKEEMGLVLECVGECRSYRGEGYVKVTWRSSIVEGDDLQTMKNSYAWVFLYDGTMVRLSPKTIVTFKEINLGTHEIFLHARINTGNVLWISREEGMVKEDLGRETDTIFLPLQFYEANHFHLVDKANENDLFTMVDDNFFIKEKYRKLNSLIAKNNEMIKKRPTYSFLTFPNGTVWGNNLRTEFVVLPGMESYLKNRTSNQLGLKDEDNPAGPVFYYRGYENKKEKQLEFGKWYKVDRDGRKIRPLDEKENIFALGEFITKRIPTIFLGREMMLQRYSAFVFDDKVGSIALALDHGYHLWGRLFAPILKEDLEKRFLFLREYTRREETTGLVQAKKFRERLLARGDEASLPVYDHSYYQRALKNFANYRGSGKSFGSESQFLNSTRRSSWHRLKNAQKIR